ncbi:unnamed protein product [Caenorhabditis angaria]|uniref:BZIP domain-containing protein n=1 Tax=Caenorhabditis angaria TaxID=860376 RepID=A0A9P1IQU0_9PELO|nr:unnamed protein product [Caenorhabditis angaria]
MIVFANVKIIEHHSNMRVFSEVTDFQIDFHEIESETLYPNGLPSPPDEYHVPHNSVANSTQKDYQDFSPLLMPLDGNFEVSSWSQTHIDQTENHQYFQNDSNQFQTTESPTTTQQYPNELIHSNQQFQGQHFPASTQQTGFGYQYLPPQQQYPNHPTNPTQQIQPTESQLFPTTTQTGFGTQYLSPLQTHSTIENDYNGHQYQPNGYQIYNNQQDVSPYFEGNSQFHGSQNFSYQNDANYHAPPVIQQDIQYDNNLFVDSSEDEPSLNTIEETPKIMRTRAKKSEIEIMSKEEREMRRRDQNNSNSKKSYDKKKIELQNLKNLFEKNKEKVEKSKQRCGDTIADINNVNDFIINYQPTSNQREYFNPQNVFELQYQIQVIETEKEDNLMEIKNNQSVRELEKNFKTAVENYKSADGDEELKNTNRGTYGTNKNRAQWKKDMAEMKLKLEKNELENDVYKNFKMKIENIKGWYKEEFSTYILSQKISLDEKHQMNKKNLKQFEKIQEFFELQDPLSYNESAILQQK